MDSQMAAALLALLSEKRQELVELAGKVFDRWIEPIDLPGPDTVIDPSARAGLTLAVGWSYDAVIAKLRELAGIVGDCPCPDPDCRDKILAALSLIGEGE